MKQNAPLMNPKAALKPLNNSWYRIEAKTENTAEVWLYDEIGYWGITAKQFANDIKALKNITHIDLRIHSPGGDVFEGTAIYNLLANHPATIHAHIDGLAASMASVIAMAADVIHMPENSMMMIHKPWGIQGGDSDDMRKYAELLEKVESTLVAAYQKKTGKPEDEIKAMLKAETWLTGAEAVDAGFADQLTPALEVAAKLNSQREYENMPKSAKRFFDPKGSTKPANVPAPAPQPEPAPQPAPQPEPAHAPQPDPSAALAQFQQQEQQRRTQIGNLFAGHPSQGELMNSCLLDMQCSVDTAKDKLLAALGAQTTPTAGVHVGNGNLVGDSVKASLLARAGLAEAEPDNRYNGFTMQELARASLHDRGISAAGDRMHMVGMAFTHTSSDFGHILQDVAHKSMLKGYDEAEETFQKFTSPGRLSDFRPAKRVDLGTFGNLDEVPEGSEYKYGTIGDTGEQIVLATYGKLFSITRQAVINDDLQAITRIPRLMGRAAIRTVADLVFAVLSGNPNMADGKKLFHADHANINTAGALSVATIGSAMAKMRTQKDGKASLNIAPKYLLTSVANELTARSLLLAEFDPANANAKMPNPIRGLLDVIADPRLDDAAFSGASFMLANQGMHDTLEVAYLDGNDKPYIEQEQGFTVDGAVFKVRIDAGVAPLSWRTMVKMPAS